MKDSMKYSDFMKYTIEQHDKATPVEPEDKKGVNDMSDFKKNLIEKAKKEYNALTQTQKFALKFKKLFNKRPESYTLDNKIKQNEADLITAKAAFYMTLRDGVRSLTDDIHYVVTKKF